MRTIILSISAFAFLLFNAVAQQPDYSQLKNDAEAQYAQGSYARANELYSRVDKTKLSPSEARWVEFRLADTAWRAQSATQTSDNTPYDRAQKQLEELIRVVDKETDRDLVWAEAHESLADLFWTGRSNMNWGGAWPHYQQALDWWAGQRDINRARDRYLKIVFRAAHPPRVNDGYFYTYYGNYIPLDVLENALKIANTQNDISHINFLLAMTMRSGGGGYNSRYRVPDQFEDALSAGRQTEWYDDALFYYAEWMANYGTIRQLEDGQIQEQPDYEKALELYRRLLREFSKGETRYYDSVQQRIKNILEPTMSIAVMNYFLPGSELMFVLNARNVQRVDFAIYKFDMTRDVRFTAAVDEEDGEGDPAPWIQRIPTAGRAPVKTWSKNIPDSQRHTPYAEQSRMDEKLPTGAYLLEAKSGSLSAREMILVSDATLVLKSSTTQALVFFTDALTSAPIPNASVALWESYYLNNRWRWRRLRQTTDANGLARFSLRSNSDNRNLFATAAVNDRQAFAAGYAYTTAQNEGWRIYAFTDRPAYRPKETLQWKFIARQAKGGAYTTPANQIVEYVINDPRGSKVTSGKATLNAFGSAWGSLELGDQLPLGEYNITFWEEGYKQQIGSAKLFRLEEYKLPEFKVAVKTPEQDGKKKAFRVGEKVEVEIQADYYFGGPVSNASVQVVVYQLPFYHYWYPHRDYPWYYDDIELRRQNYYGGQGSVVKSETIKTDATGKAKLTFDTPRENYNQDFEFRIEARVVDSSRREIVADDRVRVTRQRYYVYPRPARNIYRPKDKVTVDIKALDANEQPVQTEGTVKVTREYWWEVWIDPRGREVKGEELRELQRRSDFPPLTTRAQGRWRLKFRGYQRDELLTQTLKTDSEGLAQLNFTPDREGFYRVAWQSSQGVDVKRDRFLPPVKADTYVFVATNATTDLGYRSGGLEIVVDKDTFRTGQTAPVMISVPVPDRYVLFSVEGEDLFSYQVVHVTGNTKLIEVPIEEKHVPNIYLSALMISNAAPYSDTKQIVVPPVERFLQVAVNADREQYQPREEGTLAISAKDANGRPVSAEIALGLVDESVKYIQQDYAGDPRQFYYGQKRQHTVQTQSTLNQKSFAKFEEVAEGVLRDRKAGVNEEDEVVDVMRTKDQYRNLAGARGRGDVSAETNYAFDDGRPKKEIGPIRRGAPATLGAVAPASTPVLGGIAPAQEPVVQVRSDFRSTILWLPDVKTDADGAATVKVKYPDSLTTWSATARVVTAGNQFGIGNSSTRTKQPLIVRLQAPRFFVVGDQVTVSGVINNNTNEAMMVMPELNADGLSVTGLLIDGRPVNTAQTPVEVKANSEARVDWLVAVNHASEAKLKVQARGSKYADAMEKTFTIFEHGIEKFVTRSGKMRGDSVSIKLDIPKERRAESTKLTVQIAPSMATTMLDALPYLIDYPYGCTEQTMSRFLPAVITAKTLRDLGLKPETAMHKIFGGIEQATASATHPTGRRDLKELDEITNKSLARLYDFQHADGGWGWWKDGDSDHFMTAYVLWGMTLARQAGVDVKSDVVARAAAFLDKELVEEETNYDAQAWMLHSLAVYHAVAKQSEVSKFQSVAFDNLWKNRDRLNAYTRALLALAAHNYGYRDQAKTLIANLENGVKIDSRPDTSIVQQGAQASDPSVIGTAHWGEDGVYWRWSEGGVEATSFALRALLAIDPQNKLIEPVTNWLVKNRRGAQWSNTRDTAIVVLTLNDYLRVSGEVQPAMGYQLLVNGNPIATKQITADDALSAPSKFAISRELLRDGANEISIVRNSGSGPIYFSAAAEFFSLEEPLKPAGNEIFVRRQYFKLVNHPTLLKGVVAERVLLNDGESVKSGDRIEVVLTVEAKNNYEYLLFEDLKPAGLEAVQIRSGESLFVRELKSGGGFTGRQRWVYQELRDRKVALFIDKMPEGIWQLSYEMRAEVPGQFHALPVLGHAMYVPEIRTNGAETRLRITD
ncbi:MAG TPA: alpha-2-macroglobulin family protein [Pyrinomonadaceae bacterium]|nr:alpha-2-macroglobulin family protein [Pyrinomonadaceae bacterium]